MQPLFVMTVDVDPPISTIPSHIVEQGVTYILNLLNRHEIKATFFVPSIIAEHFPTVLSAIVKQKNEIACHGLKHDPLEATLSESKQIQMIKKATETIQSISGSRPVGYRAPLFRINRNCWKALQKNGYMYDSSVVYSPFYKSHKIVLLAKPFFLQVSRLNGRKLLEIPVSVNPFLPFPLGGAWIRIFGFQWSKIGVKMNFIFQNPVVFYIHPKDVVPRTYGRSWYSYRSTANCIEMLDKLIKYVKEKGAKFLRAYELANFWMEMC